MAVGGLAVPDKFLSEITAGVNSIKRECHVTREVKWTSTRVRRDCPHTKLADYLKLLIDQKKVHFHIRFAPFKTYDHSRSGRKDLADTTGKAFFQLLYHRALRFYGRHYKLHIRPDNGDCTSQLIHTKDSLEMQAWAKYQSNISCISSLQTRSSEKEPILQLLDVTLGALTAYRNSKHELESTSHAKRNLAIYVHEIHGKPNLKGNSSPKKQDFSIWNVKPKY